MLGNPWTGRAVQNRRDTVEEESRKGRCGGEFERYVGCCGKRKGR